MGWSLSNNSNDTSKLVGKQCTFVAHVSTPQRKEISDQYFCTTMKNKPKIQGSTFIWGGGSFVWRHIRCKVSGILFNAYNTVTYKLKKG